MAEGQYVKVYHCLKDEYPSVWASDPLLGTYVQLLVVADKWWPQLAPRPFGRPTYAYRKLVECGLVVESPDKTSFTMKGLDKERRARSEHGKRAASIRWGNAPSNAQLMPSKAEQNKAEQIDAHASNGAPLPPVFMGFRQKPAKLTEEQRRESIAHNRSLLEETQDPAIARAARKALQLLGVEA